MMKRIKTYVFTFFLILAVISLTACATTKKNNGTTTAGTTAAKETTAAAGTAAQSTGVAEGAVDKVEEGVDKLTGESAGESAAVDGTAASK